MSSPGADQPVRRGGEHGAVPGADDVAIGDSTTAPKGGGRLPLWSGIAGLLTPIALIGGWSLAAAAQPIFDAVTQTISALASLSAYSRWIMTFSLLLTGLCHLSLAVGLTRVIPRPGPVLLGVGGLATIGVAFAPLACSGGANSCGAEPSLRSTLHSTLASITFVCLSVWPLAAAWSLRRAYRPYSVASVLAGIVLTGLLIRFGIEVNRSAFEIGRNERVLAGAQALWPAATALWFLLLAARARQAR